MIQFFIQLDHHILWLDISMDYTANIMHVHQPNQALPRY